MAGNDDDPLRIGGITRPTGAAAVEGPAATEGAEAIAGIAPTEIDAIGAVTAALDAGAIDGDAALRALIDATTAAVLGPGADPIAIEAIRAEVATLLAGDPTLATLLRP